MTAQTLEALRQKVDVLDTRIVALLAERIETTNSLGRIKASSGLPASDPARRNHRTELLKSLAIQFSLDQTLILAVYDVISRDLVAAHKRFGAKDS